MEELPSGTGCSANGRGGAARSKMHTHPEADDHSLVEARDLKREAAELRRALLLAARCVVRALLAARREQEAIT